MRFQFIGTALFFLLVLGSGCRKDTLPGTEVQPAEQQLGLISTNAFTINARTVREDSLRSNAQPFALLGQQQDPVFGYSEASFITQIQLSSTNVDWGDTDSITIDSVVLSFDYFSTYGSLSPVTVEVFEITERLTLEDAEMEGTNYYSDFQVAVNPVPILVEPNIEFDPLDSAQVGDNTESPQLRLRLPNELGRRLIELDPEAYTSNDAFIDHFNGFQIQLQDQALATGEGPIALFDLLSDQSQLVVYYSSTVTGSGQEFSYLITEDAVRINQFDHDYAGSVVQQALDNADDNETVYVQSMAGVKTELTFPDLQVFADSIGTVAIQKAELTFTIEGEQVEFPAHSSLIVVEILEDGSAVALVDLVVEGLTHFGGSFEDNSYSMNITRYMQNLIQELQAGESTNRGLYVIDGGGATNPNRTPLLGLGNDVGDINLRISYVPVN